MNSEKYTFQTELMFDIKKDINESNNLLISVDKSRNTYIMQKDVYNKYVRENITKIYKRSTAKSLKYQFQIEITSREVSYWW